MARTGNFGRQPRSAPSITNTLIAIAREQQSREDQNIMDAWQKGGVVDGKEVTDEMVLKHWQQRLEDISPEDPLYETYSNSVLQLEYTIAQSKMTAQYALIADPSPGDNMKMANFFLKWAKKVPKNSEFYRVLQRDAGQYMRAAKARRAQAAQVDTEKVYQSQMASLERRHEAPGQEALKVISLLASTSAAVGQVPIGNRSDAVQRTNIGDISALGGVDALLALLGTAMDETPVMESVAPGVAGAPTVVGEFKSTPNAAKVLYTDQNTGQQVTGADLVQRFAALDPNFNGKFDLAYIQGAVNGAREGMQKRIDLARKTGHIAQASQLEYEQAKLNEAANQIDAYPVATAYNDLHEKLSAVFNDGTLLPDAKVARIESLRQQMGKLSKDPRIADDQRMQTQLMAEATGQVGVPTLAEDLSGSQGGFTSGLSSGGDIAAINAHLELYAEQRDNVATGDMVMTQGAYVQDDITGKVKFVAQTGGPSIGAATMQAIKNLPGAGEPEQVLVSNGDNGGFSVVFMVPAPIMVSATDPITGAPLEPMNSKPAGAFLRYMENGVEVTKYRIERGGKTEWTNDPPVDTDKVDISVNGGAMTFTFEDTASPSIPTDGRYQDGTIPGFPGFAILGAKPASGKTPAKPGSIVFMPQDAIYGTDMPRWAAGPDPYTDSFSAALAGIAALPDGPAALRQWVESDVGKQVLDYNARKSAGMSIDVNGLWSGGAGAEAAYRDNLDAMTHEVNVAISGDKDQFLARSPRWKQDSIDALVPEAAKNVMSSGSMWANKRGGSVSNLYAQPLPTTTLQQEPEARFKALGFGFKPGTSTLANPGKVADDKLTLTTGLNLKVPAINLGGFSGMPSPVAPPPATVAPKPAATTGYTPPPSTYTPPASTYKPPVSSNTYKPKDKYR